jgi:F-type H+-transporting ATPase subunit delta
MANEGVFALRYAHAFADVVKSQGLDRAAAQKQMADFAGSYSGSHELREVFEDPSIPTEQKLAVLDELASRIGMMREVRNFIAVIMDHHRLGELSEIIAAYDRLADTGQGIVDAQVVSAFPLNDEDRRELEQQVARLAASKVRVHYLEDRSLLGGAIVKIGSTVYDGSVRGQLEQLKQTLVNA